MATAEALPGEARPGTLGRGVGYQIPRNTLALLMVAEAAVVAPFLFHLSPWIIAVGLFAGCWRSGVYQGRWNYPRRWVKVVLVGASVAGVAVSGVQAYSLEAAASLLILAFALKLIEMKSRRDAYLVIFLGYFLIAIAFLFDQTISLAAYQAGALVLVTAAMVGLNQLATRVRPLESLRMASVLILQALPLTLVLFLFFPRIAPLWSVPLPSGSTTGLSERMTPGDVAELIRSDELAFRVSFEGPVPHNRDLYWRGLVYSRFEAGTWSVADELPEWPSAQAPDAGAGVAAGAPAALPVEYEVMLEPSRARWLYALAVPRATTPGVSLTRDYRLEARDPVASVFRYRVTSDPGRPMDAPVLTEPLRERETRLPEDDNPRLREFARTLWAATGNEQAFVAAVLARIRAEPYFYTLSPPRLARSDSIDEFWFDTRRGFCSHYAGATVFMLRSVGIPARMVGGYQGGQINPVTGHLVVRQYDAHAWVEYWRPDHGWQRVDPTGAVAPARIEQGLEAALSAGDRESLSTFTNARFQGLAALRSVLHWADSLEHRWNLWVVGYDPAIQAGFLEKLLGEVTPARLGAAMLMGGGVSLAVVALALFWRRRPVRRHPVEAVFAGFCRAVAGAGWSRAPAEPPGAFIRRIAAAGGMDADQAVRLVAELERLLYNPDARWAGADVRALRRRLRRLQFRLMFGSVR